MFISQLIIVITACLLDRWLGEPSRWHPLVGFGRLAQGLEKRWNRPDGGRGPGLFALVTLLALPTLLAGLLSFWLLSQPGWGQVAYVVCAIGGLYWALGWRSLVLHVRAVAEALEADDLPLAREQVGRIVSRDCRQASALQVRQAAVESALENASDAIVAPLFWFIVAGLPGVVLYRLSNTLDAMWGYKTPRLRQFGWAAARWDDLLNWLPARITAWGFVLCGHTRSARRAWKQQAALCASPNAGPVMCAGAGALQLRVGGPSVYAGETLDKPWIGLGRSPDNDDIVRSLTLVKRAVMGALLLWALVGLAYHGYNALL